MIRFDEKEKVKGRLKNRRPVKVQRRLSVIIYPQMIERKYEVKLVKIINGLRDEIIDTMIAALPELKLEFDREMGIKTDAIERREDDFTKSLNRIVNGMLVSFGDNLSAARKEIRKIASETNTWNTEQMKRVAKEALGIDLMTADKEIDAALDLWVRDNVRGIANLASTESKRVEQILVDGFRNGYRHEEVAKGILDVFKASGDRETSQAQGLSLEDRARSLARDQMGKLNAQITRTRQTRLGLSRYIWRTSKDERVRESHRKLEGRVFYWNPRDGEVPEEGHPGIPYNCRCWAEPMFEDLFVDE